jgi:hypothetical protein
MAPVGAIVALYVDLERRVMVEDIVETRTGRGYRVLVVRMQERGKKAGRQHLRCVVLGEDWLHDLMVTPRDNRWVHRIRWYRRKAGAGVVSR